MRVVPAFIVSDSTGITAETLGNSLLSQFPDIKFDTQTLPFTNDDRKISAAIEQINQAAELFETKPLVFITFVQHHHRDRLKSAKAIFFDLFDTFIKPLEQELGAPSTHTLGRSHAVLNPDRYTSRISAVNYTVHCDDGLNPQDYDGAQLILTGVSRSGKTPACLYLALHFGTYAANYPITDDDFDRGELPKSVLKHKKKLFGLTIDPERLQQIRQERRGDGQYANYAKCVSEVQQAEALFRRYRIPNVDTSTMSVEEISATVLHKMKLKRNVLASH